MKFNYKTYNDLLLDIKRNIHKIPADIDLVVGIPRSGMIPAYMLGLTLNVNVCSFNEFINRTDIVRGNRQVGGDIDNVKKIIIIDDSVCEGNAMNKVKKIIKSKETPNIEIYFVAVYVRPGSEYFVDIALTELATPRIFQWNYLNHGHLVYSCFDIDGVLCIDPTEEENDDGIKYRNFILNAKPLYIPKYKIKALVTSRLEKYRPGTEQWLKDNNVQYEKLYMLDMPSKEERLKGASTHAIFKASIYTKLKDCYLFYESNRKQAIEIAQMTGKMVFSVETDELINNKIKNYVYERKRFRSKSRHIMSNIFNAVVPARYAAAIKVYFKNHLNIR